MGLLVKGVFIKLDILREGVGSLPVSLTKMKIHPNKMKLLTGKRSCSVDFPNRFFY